MNDSFNAKRFVLLLKKTFLEKPMQMFGFTALIFLFIFIVYFIMKTYINYQAAQNITFFLGLVVGDFILGSFVFNHFSTAASGSFYLTLPVSNFERWLCAVLIAGVLYPLIFLVFFRIMDTGFVTSFHNSLDANNPFYQRTYDSVYLFPFNGDLAKQCFPMFLIFSGMMLIGSLYFNKVALVKVALAICILFFGIFVLNYLFAFLIFQNVHDAFPFQSISILVGKETGTVDLPKSIHEPIWYFISFALPIILWGLSFIRLQEKEF